MMIALCVNFTLLFSQNIFSSDDYQKNDKIIYKYIKEKYSKKKNVSLDCKLQKIDETRNYLIEEIKHNDVMSEKQ